MIFLIALENSNISSLFVYLVHILDSAYISNVYDDVNVFCKMTLKIFYLIGNAIKNTFNSLKLN